MKRLLVALVATTALSACASVPVAPVIIPSVGPATQENWEAGQAAYLAWNGARKGWTTTASGLQYRRVGKAAPNGAQPVATDTVRVHYAGTFIDNREFDSSYSRGEPASFPLNRVIKGWTEGVALMREGETYQFVIPADLAYGARWVGQDIPPNSVLKFQVELLAVNPAP
ncbi:FKBP-type peptidyl-prolyl cis-trans isomerase [Brevundimonas variabilis]|uniref:Peptidyl-prolyl cis-trans isomerase n=1 Tax=Brevundimonas variabilis TaxID=74312 RepID=A0A7W9CIR2_9CAUL|nr:FKBP-type peptidyl-prolyl cis-trans isomerase [Brevundimonas variabilis]MBB5745952.1 FKBP-type peptidyl-prolyl cis-trans isomerase FkpA [Brevundimonas variabilis]